MQTKIDANKNEAESRKRGRSYFLAYLVLIVVVTVAGAYEYRQRTELKRAELVNCMAIQGIADWVTARVVSDAIVSKERPIDKLTPVIESRAGTDRVFLQSLGTARERACNN